MQLIICRHDATSMRSTGNIAQVELDSDDSSFQFVEPSIDDDGHRDARVPQVEPDHSSGSGDGYWTIRLAGSRYQIGQQLADHRGHRNSTAVTTNSRNLARPARTMLLGPYNNILGECAKLRTS